MGSLVAIVQKLEAKDEIWPSSRRYAATGERCSLSLANVREASAWYTTDNGDYIVLYGKQHKRPAEMFASFDKLSGSIRFRRRRQSFSYPSAFECSPKVCVAGS